MCSRRETGGCREDAAHDSRRRPKGRFSAKGELAGVTDGRRENLRVIVRNLQDVTIRLATGHRSTSYEEWERARDDAMAQLELVSRLPEWVITNRSGSQLWSFIKQHSATYQGRREFIWSSFSPVLEMVERGSTEPTARSLEPGLVQGLESVTAAWLRAQARRDTDPEGAITAARSLVEAVCKHILEARTEPFEDADDLPRLYKRVASILKLSPSDHSEQVFRQVLSGCVSVVVGLASLRNALGDAHGKRTAVVRPAARHADLAINLAGSLATFLLATHNARK